MLKMDELKITTTGNLGFIPRGWQPNQVLDVVSPPKRSDWICYLFGTGKDGLTLRPTKGHELNWFWRWMQYLCFGNEWKKEKEL